MSRQKRLVLSLVPLAGGWLLFRWAGGRSSFDAVLAIVASAGGAAVLLSAFSRRVRVVVALVAAALLYLDVRGLHETLRGEHRDDGAGLPAEDAPPRAFVSAARTRPSTFAVWADARGGADVFEKVRDLIASRRPAFSVGVGDLVGMARRYQFEVLRDQMATGTSSPALFVPGNHDVDPFGTLHPYRRVLGAPRWAFVEGGVIFVGLDASSGRLSGDDVEWLRRAGTLPVGESSFDEPKATPFAPMVLFAHYPLFPPTGRPDKALPQNDDATKRVQAFAQEWRALVLCGSYHAYDRIEVGGATQIVTGGAGSKLEGPGGHHVLFVTVAANGLSVEKADIAGTSSPLLARALVLRDESAWLARGMPVRFARVWLLLALALGGTVAAVGGGPSPGTRATAPSVLPGPHAQQREPGAPA